MLKIVTLLNLTGLFLFRALFLADVMITHDVPATMEPGSEVKVTVTIDKGTLNGFAKLQIDLPEGLTANAIDTKGASFTYYEGKAKFIWMALPNQPQFKVTYTLTAAATATGSLPITGKFSYVEDNERKTEELPITSVTLTGSTPVEAAAPPQIEAPANANDVTFAGGAAPVSETPAMVEAASGVAPQQGDGNVSVSRTITPVTPDEMLVEVVINKGSLRGFGKLQETIPPGFTALEKTSSEAIFTAQDRTLKFVWLNLPQAGVLKVAYRLRGAGQPEGDYAVNGEFGYLLNDQTQKATAGTTSFSVGAKAQEALARTKAAGNDVAASSGQQAGNTRNVPATNAQTTAQTTAQTNAQTSAQASAQGAAGGAGQTSSARNTSQPGGQQPAVTAAANAARTADQAMAQAGGSGDQASAKGGSRSKLTGQVSAPETGITYKVQITAAHREVGGDYFAERHRFLGDFGIERHEGWIKYVTGRHAEYRSARDQRQEFISAGHNFPGPFVTAYNAGQRITVQEALMISNQRWVQ